MAHEAAGPSRNTSTCEVEVDHLGYLTSRPYRRAVHAALRRTARKAGVTGLHVLHERDDRCCEMEAWTATAWRINAALDADGCPTLWTFWGGAAS